MKPVIGTILLSLTLLGTTAPALAATMLGYPTTPHPSDLHQRAQHPASQRLSRHDTGFAPGQQGMVQAISPHNKTVTVRVNTVTGTVQPSWPLRPCGAAGRR